MTVEHIANQCHSHLATYGIDCDSELVLNPEIIACFSRLDEMTPFEYASVFQAAKKKTRDILSFEEVMRDYANLKDLLAAALKEIVQLEKNTAGLNA